MLAKWLSDETAYGGVLTHTISLAKEIGKLSTIDFHVVSFGDRSETIHEDFATITLIKSRLFFFVVPFLAVIRLLFEIEKIRPDIVHVQGGNLSPYLLFAAFSCRYKRVFTFHATLEELIAEGFKRSSLRYRTEKYLMKTVLNRADLIIAVSSHIRESLMREFSESAADKIVVIPNGVDSSFLESTPTNEEVVGVTPSFNDEFVIFTAKKFVKYNGQEYLIKAMPQILKAIPSAKLVLAGDGPQKEELKGIISNLHIDDRVLLLDPIPHRKMQEYFAQAAVVVVPSANILGKEEGTSIFLLEGMAMGKPVIATNLGGSKEIVSDGITGLLIPDKNPHAIAKAVLRLFQDPQFAAQLGGQAREYIKKSMTWGRIAAQTISLYTNLLANSDLQVQ